VRFKLPLDVEQTLAFQGHRPICDFGLEPISKLFEQDAQGCKLHETEEIGWVVLPAN
jgi:hypothetical protein